MAWISPADAQAEYVCWRDGKVKHGGNRSKISDQKSCLPAADPGALLAHRWRKSFCFKGETGTINRQSTAGPPYGGANRNIAVDLFHRPCNIATFVALFCGIGFKS